MCTNWTLSWPGASHCICYVRVYKMYYVTGEILHMGGVWCQVITCQVWLGPLSAGSRLNWDFLAKKMWHHFWAEDSSVGLQLQDVHRFYFFWFMDVYGCLWMFMVYMILIQVNWTGCRNKDQIAGAMWGPFFFAFSRVLCGKAKNRHHPQQHGVLWNWV